MPSSLFTVGYEGRSIDVFLDEVAAHGINRVVDVRELPLSRRRGFSKTRLGEALAARGITYSHIRPLGNPKANRERYWSGDIEGGAEVYRQHLHNGSYPTLLQLADELDGEATCLMCLERDHDRCHRAVIVDALGALRPNLQICHL
jgi:uncharacterized protein (DUF488 family)